MALAFGTVGAVLGAAVGWFRRRGEVNRGRSAAIAGFAGLALAVGVGQVIFPPPGSAEQIGRELDRQAVFRIAFAMEPALRAQLIERLERAGEKGGPEAYLVETEKVGNEISRRFFPVAVSRASAASLDRFVDFTIDLLQERYEAAPDACYAYVAGAEDTADGLAGLPSGLRRAGDAAKEAVAASSEGHVVTLSDAGRQAAMTRLAEIVAGLTAGPEGASLYVADYDRFPATTAEARKGACLFALRLHQAIKAVPQPQRAALIRVTMGSPATR